jgi:hypothetical protein
VDAVADDRDASLNKMREQMLSRTDLDAAVFIGGMEGVETECEMFRRLHPDGQILCVGATGGAARDLAIRLKVPGIDDVDFARLFRSALLPQPG